MKEKFLFPIYLFLISIAMFIFSGIALNGSIASKQSTASEIFSSPESIYNYNITTIPPFKYRVLFPALVQGTYALTKGNSEDSDLFYNIYIAWMAITYICATIVFYYLLITVGFSPIYSFVGGLIFLLSPAVVYAFSVPVHTREDFLGYSILCLGLISIIKKRMILVLLFSILGALCRETLLILPFLYLFFQTSEKLYKRMTVVIAGFITFFTIRFIIGYESYDAVELGLSYNLKNPAESIGFIFIVFSYMWIFFFIDNHNFYIKGLQHPNNKIQFFRKSSLWVFILVFLTTLIAGRFNEIRLLHLLFPWMIIITLLYIKQYIDQIKELFKDSGMMTVTLILLAFFNIAAIIGVDEIRLLFPQSRYIIPYEQWIVITFVYLYIFLITLIVVIRLKDKALSEEKEFLKKALKS